MFAFYFTFVSAIVLKLCQKKKTETAAQPKQEPHEQVTKDGKIGLLPGLSYLNVNADSAKAEQKKTDGCFVSQGKRKCAKSSNLADSSCHFKHSDEKHLNDGLGGDAGQKFR